MQFFRKLAIVEVILGSAFRYLWLSQFFSQVAINLLTFILALRIYDLTHKNTAVSLLALSFSVPQFLFGALAGILVDRYDKKMVLFLCNFSRAIAVLGFLLTRESLAFVYLLAVVISVITQFFVPAEAPTIPTLVPHEDLLIANGIFTLTIFATMLVGGLFAGPVLDLLGISRVFVVIAALFFLSVGFISQLPGQKVTAFVRRKIKYVRLNGFAEKLSRETVRKLHAEFLEGLAFLQENRNVRTSLLLLVGSQTLVASISILLPGFADQVLHIPINDASVLLFGPAIVGIILGAAIISQYGYLFPRRWVVNLGLFLIAVFLILLSNERRLVFSQLFLFMLGFANALIDVSSNTTLQEETGDEVRSRVYGILTSLGGAFFVLPVIGSGIISDSFGVGRAFALAGVAVLIIGIYRLMRTRVSLLP